MTALRRLVALPVAAALLVAGCSTADRLDELSAPEPCADAGVAAQILDCVVDSLAVVTTPAGQGSGMLLAGGHVVTNAHVIDPFGAATVTFIDGEAHEAPVVGVDLFADVAVLGPIDTSRPPLALRTERPDLGDDVFSVGFPLVAGVSDPQPTITSGLLSRVQTFPDFGITDLQSDATIEGGQSGGALTDDRARIVGMTSASVGEFAVALAATNVAQSVERILAGDGDPYRMLPDPTDRTDASILDGSGGFLIWPDPAGGERQLTFDTDDIDLTVYTTDWHPLYATERAVERITRDHGYDTRDEYGTEVLDAEQSGHYHIPSDWDGPLRAQVVGATGTVVVEANVPIEAVFDSDGQRALVLDERHTGILDSLEFVDSYIADLATDEAVEVQASSPVSDLLVEVFDAETGELVASFDDGAGPYGLDPTGTFKAPVAGPYVFTVESLDRFVSSVGYALEVGSG